MNSAMTPIAVTADVTDRDSLIAAASLVADELGGADVLVNNAGVMLLAPFSSEQQKEIRQMVETNLLGAMTATEVFLDQLRDGGGGPGECLLRRRPNRPPRECRLRRHEVGDGRLV